MWGTDKPRFISLPPYESAYVYQAPIPERDYDIKHLGAVININIIKKEDTLMVEKLRAYRAELEAKKASIYAEDYIPQIEEDVKLYREALIKASEENRAKAIAKVDSDIDCVDTLITREEEAISAEATITG